jgi:hypothetical protein
MRLKNSLDRSAVPDTHDPKTQMRPCLSHIRIMMSEVKNKFGKGSIL